MARDRLKEIEVILAHLMEDRSEAFDAGDFDEAGHILAIMDRLEDEAAMIRECEADLDYHYGVEEAGGAVAADYANDEIPF